MSKETEVLLYPCIFPESINSGKITSRQLNLNLILVFLSQSAHTVVEKGRPQKVQISTQK